MPKPPGVFQSSYTRRNTAASYEVWPRRQRLTSATARPHLPPAAFTRGTSVTLSLGGGALGGASGLSFFNLSSGAPVGGVTVSNIIVNSQGTSLTAYGDANAGMPLTVPVIRRDEFLPDTQRIGRGVRVGIGDWREQLEANKNAFALEFVTRQRFQADYTAGMSPAQFVDRLNQNSGGVLSHAEREQLAAELAAAPDSSQGRAGALRKVAEHAELRRRETNRAFVLMRYYGYLRRNPNDAPDADWGGWLFWLSKLEEFRGNFVEAGMVKAFISSIECRNRFGR